MIAPFTASDEESEKSQLEFYQFMVSIYQGMYKEPEKYLVFPTPYEEYAEKKKVRKKEKVVLCQDLVQIKMGDFS